MHVRGKKGFIDLILFEALTEVEEAGTCLAHDDEQKVTKKGEMM